MSAPVTTQLRDYFTYVDEEQVHVDIEALQTGEVRVLSRGEPQPRRGWVYAAAAAVAILVLVGGMALLWSSNSTAEPATVTTVVDEESAPDEVVRSDDAAAAHEVAVRAFSALGEADFEAFLAYLHPDGVVSGNEIRRFDFDTRVTSISGPGLSGTDLGPLDVDEDGVLSRAEFFLLEAQHLAVVPADVLECEATSNEATCSIADSAPFYRIQGIDVGPFEVAIAEGLITEIHLPTAGTHGHVGSCGDCRSLSSGVYDYHVWLGLIPPAAMCSTDLEDVPIEGCWTEQLGSEDEYRKTIRSDPMSIWAVSGEGAGSSFIDHPWIKPVAFGRHRELMPEWLASREPVGGPSDARWLAIDATFEGIPPAYGFTDVTRSELGLIATSADGSVWLSSDGADWTRATSDAEPVEPQIGRIAASGRGIVHLVPGLGAWHSSNGVEWVALDVDTPEGASLVNTDVAASLSGFVMSTGTATWFSADGREWEQVLDEAYQLTFGGGAFYATDGWSILRSVDGSTWREVLPRAAGTDIFFTDVAASSRGVVAISSDSVWFSPDGVLWEVGASFTPELPRDDLLWRIAAADSGFLIAGLAEGGLASHVWFSADGVEWSGIPIGASSGRGYVWDMTETSAGFLAVGDGPDDSNPGVWAFAP